MRLPPPGTARRLIAARAARSLGQGALVVDFALYLQALGWNAAGIGSLFAASLLLGVAVTLAAGPLSDRLGRRRFLIGYEIVQMAAAGIALGTSRPGWLAAAAILGAFGRGANGSAGPFGPLEQAWLADGLKPPDFVRVYGLNAATGFFGMGAGAFLGMIPAALMPWLPGALAYRPLFAVVALGSIAAISLIFAATDTPRPAQAAPPPAVERRSDRHWLLRLVTVNALTGLGNGIVGPFMAYWLHLRFGVGPAQIGPVIGLGFLLAAVSTLATGALARRIGLVDAVVGMRVLGLALLLLLPLSPSYAVAAVLYILRGALGRGTAGARQALNVQLTGAGRRGLSTSLGTVSAQLPRAIAPLLGGWMLDNGLLLLPFIVAAGLQGAAMTLYRVFFRSHPAGGRD